MTAVVPFFIASRWRSLARSISIAQRLAALSVLTASESHLFPFVMGQLTRLDVGSRRVGSVSGRI